MRPLLSACLILCLTGAAGAQTPREEAARLLKEAQRLHDVRDYETALTKYEEVQKLLPAARLDLHVAATLEALGRTVEAAERLERAIRRARKADDAVQERAARRRLEALLRNVASIRVTCSVLGATVMVDGRTVGEVPIEKRIYVPPGSHRLRVRAQSYTSFDQALVLYPGDHPMVTVNLARATRGHRLAPAPRRRVWTWIALAGAGATFAVGGGIGLWAMSDFNEHEKLVKKDTLDDRDEKRLAELKSGIPKQSLAANILYGVSGALAVTAVVLFFTEVRDARPDRPRADRRVEVVPLGTGLALRF